jgi:hypothetical protein
MTGMGRRQVPENPPGTNGLVRHPALRVLSREHHGVLRQALWLRRAGEAAAPPPAARAAGEYLDFYECHLLPHVTEEEDVLLPLAGHADPEGAARVRAEHRELHEATAALRAALSEGADLRPAARDLGQMLHDHVRFEERAFFTKIQAVLSPAAFQELQRALRPAGACPLPRP